jgi:hypothetical protein
MTVVNLLGSRQTGQRYAEGSGKQMAILEYLFGIIPDIKRQVQGIIGRVTVASGSGRHKVIDVFVS